MHLLTGKWFPNGLHSTAAVAQWISFWRQVPEVVISNLDPDK